MSNELKSIIYISKRCPYCRKLLLLLQTKPELKGSIQITSVDDEPFPKIIKSVPSMVTNGEIWNAEEIFAALDDNRNNVTTTPQNTPNESQQNTSNEDSLQDYYQMDNNLSYAPIEGGNIIDDSNYASIDEEDVSVDTRSDGYITNNKKATQFDNDYEKLMSDRSNLMSEMKN